MLSEAEGEVETSPGRVPLVYNYVIAVKVLDEMSLSRGSFDCAQDDTISQRHPVEIISEKLRNHFLQ